MNAPAPALFPPDRPSPERHSPVRRAASHYLRWRAPVLAALTFLGLVRAEAAELIFDLAGNLTQIRAAASGPPQVLASPRHATLPPGATASFSVTFFSSTPTTVQWVFNGSSIAGATTDSLVLSSVTGADVGNYQAILANAQGSATSAVARLELDVDADGLADAWELNYFGSITNQTALSDQDGDGNSNLTEYRESTNPTNSASLLPRLTVLAQRGEVRLTPDLPWFTNGQNITLAASPDPGQTFLGWSGVLIGVTNPTTLTLRSNSILVGNFGLPLSAVLGVTNRVVLEGSALWFGQAGIGQDGGAAGRSGRIGHNQKSTLILTNFMTREGTVSFGWKVDSHINADYLSFYINGVLQPGRLAGAVPWESITYYLTSGVSIVRWEYTKNQRDGSQSDATFTWSPSRNIYNLVGYYSAEDWAGLDDVVWEEWADPTRDADQDGVPDLWEWKWFYSLAETGANDPDRDGISNRDEYLENTNPNSNISLKPRLTLSTYGPGAAGATPVKLKYDYAETVSLSATSAPGAFFVGWDREVYTTNLTTPLTLFGNRRVRATFGLPVPTALNAPALNWRSGGGRQWFGQTNITHDAGEAAQSGPIRFGDITWLETDVVGPGTFSWWSKVSALTNANDLRVFLNGIEQPGRLTGEVDWQLQVWLLAEGTNTVRWQYRQGTDSTNIANAAYLDQVTFAAGAVAPDFVLQPTNQSAFQGSNVAFHVMTGGTPPVFHQLLREGQPVTAWTTNRTLIFPNVTTADAGLFSVRATNTAGLRTSDTARLTVLPVPPVNDNFAAAALIVGASSTVTGYSVGATSEPGEPAVFSDRRTVWWRWTAPQTGKFRVLAESTGPSMFLIVRVYQGSSLPALVEVLQASDGTSFTNGTYLASAYGWFDATAGVTYALVLDTSFTDAPRLSLTLSRELPPLNDQFAARIPLSGTSASFAGNNVAATREPNEPPVGFFPGSNSVWWTWTAPANGNAALSCTAPNFSASMAVFRGSTLASLTVITNNEFGSPGPLVFPVVAGVSYPIVVDGLFGQGGEFQGNVALRAAVLAAASFSASAGFNVSFAAPAGSGYVITKSADLATWAFVIQGQVPFDGLVRLSVPAAANPTTTFYRIQLSD